MTDPLLLPDRDRDTRQRLIDAGLEIFGTYNLEGATTRQLAEHAGVNQAAIPYYFGGKEGLYFAVIEHLFSTNFAVIGPVVTALQGELASKKPTRDEALALLKKLLNTMLERILARKASSTWARIIMREQMQPTQAFSLIYEKGIRRVHEAVAMLLAIILEKKPTDRRVILRSHMVVGQILIFLAGRETIRRRLNLTGYTDEEVKEIKQALDDQLELLRSATEARK
ncbi:MAG TPA: CerR family C-terminal domain-containing protein [Chthoniobacterales bacterium]|nr:CerR family C-terminal domain-containing protein [Chthoniobacterales bacterium]